MTDDLADRISSGAVAVLDLVPDDPRFADLTQFVLKGGASRFSPVVSDEEPIRYVVPVGVPGARLYFGTLLIQRSRCALVWRTDPLRPYQAFVTQLGPDTSIRQTPATVQGEVWGRFDLRSLTSASMTFLVPPVTTPALPRTLQRVLLTEPGCRPGSFDVAPLPPGVTDYDPVSSSSPDLPVSAPSPLERVWPTVAPAAPATSVTDTVLLPPDSFAEEPAAAVGADAPIVTVPTGPAPTAETPISPAEFDLAPVLSPDETIVVAPPLPEPLAGREEPVLAAEPDGGEFTDPVTSDQFYRERERVVPEVPSSPTNEFAAPMSFPVPPPPPMPAATLAPLPAPAVPAPRPGLPDSARSFLLGFGVTVLVGALILVARALGWIG